MDKPTIEGAVYGLTILLMIGFLGGSAYFKSWAMFLTGAVLFVVTLVFALRQSDKHNDSSNIKYH